MGSWEEYKATVAARTEAINNGASAEQAAQVYQAGNSGKATGSLPTSSSKSSSNNLTGIAQKRATSAAKQLQSQLASGNTSTGAKINALMRSGVSGKEASYLARFNNSYQVLNAINQAGGMDAGTSTSQVSALANGISTINTREKSQKKLTSSTDLTSKKGILGAKNGGLTHEEFVAAQEKEKQKDADLGWFIVDEETGKLRRTTQDDYNKYYANKLEMIAKGNLAGKERVGTGFFDRFGANFSIGFITQEKNNAANDYMNNPSEANRQYLEELTALEQQAMQNNANPLNAEGGVISKDLASWIPQGMNQMKETAVPTLAGIATGNPLITKGAVVYGSTAASFNTMRGAAFSNLTALGYDEETARNAATDEALISAIIEGGETAIDVFAGVGKAAVTALSGKTITKAAAESFTKTLVKEAGKYGLNIASEGFEEALQEIVSIANEMRLADGKGNGGTDELLTYCKKAIPSVLGGENTERVKESFAGGARLGALLGAAETGVGHVATRVSANVQAKPTQQTQTAENIIDNETPITTPTQQTPVQETATTQQATETVQPQQSNTPTLDAIAEKQKSAKSLAEEVINNDTAYAEFVAEYGNPGNTKSEKRNAIASVIEQKRAQNQQTAQTTQTETVVEPQTTVTEQVQATPQTQTTVPPTSPRQNILERIRNTFGNKQTTQTISDNVVTIDSEGEISNGGNTDNLNVDNTDAYKQVQDANVTIANGTKDIGNGYSVKSSINKKSLTATLTLYKDGNIISTFRYNIPLDGNFNMGDSTIGRYIANEIIKHENGETATATPVTETPTAQNPLTQNKVEETVAETTPTENTQNTVAETQTEQTQQFTPQEQTNATQEVKPQENATQTATEQTKAEPTTSTDRKIPRNITTNYKSIETKQNALRQSATGEQTQTVQQTTQPTTEQNATPQTQPVQQADTTVEETPQRVIKPLTNQDAEYQAAIDIYGAKEKGENPARDVSVPKRTSPGTKESDVTRTVMEAEAIPEERLPDIRSAVMNGELNRIPISNKTLASNAATKVDKVGFERALRDWTADVRAGKKSDALTAMGAELLNRAANSDMSGEEFIDILVDYEQMASGTGSALQAQRILKTLTPAGKAYVMKKTASAIESQMTTKGKLSGKKQQTVQNAQTAVKEAVSSAKETAAKKVAEKLKVDPKNKDIVFTFEYTDEAGDMIAKAVEKKVLQETTGGRKRTAMESLVNNIKKFALEKIPSLSAKQSLTAKDLLAEFVNNPEFAQGAYKKAQAQVKESMQNADATLENGGNFADIASEFTDKDFNLKDSNIVKKAIAQSAFDTQESREMIRNQASLGISEQQIGDYIANPLINEIGAEGDMATSIREAAYDYVSDILSDDAKTTEERINREVNKAMSTLGETFKNLAISDEYSRDAAKRAIGDFLTMQYGVDGKSATKIADGITKDFESKLNTAIAEELDRRYGEKEKKAKDVKSLADKIAEAVNLGSFTSKYADKAVEDVFGIKGIELNENLIQDFLNAETDQERDNIVELIQKDIARQIPSTIGDKFTALRYMNMLGNLKTQERNFAGNVIMGTMNKSKNMVKEAIETVAQVLSGGKYQKQYSNFYGSDLAKIGYADIREDKLIQKAAMGSKWSGEKNDFIGEVNDKRTIFKFGDNALTRGLGIANKQGLIGFGAEGYRKGTSAAMDIGDVVFVRANYADGLAGYLKAHGITAEQWNEMVKDPNNATVNAAREFAIKQAQETTFRDNNKLSDFATSIGRGWRNSDNIIAKTAGKALQGIQPFVKTPANVLARMIEYSPLGLINTMYNATMAINGSDNVTGTDVINSASKVLTGTGLAYLGFAMAAAGMAKTKNDDDKLEAFEQLNGKQDYSININVGDEIKSLTADWMTPATGAFFMGVAAYEQTQGNPVTMSSMLKIIGQTTAPMMEMSMLQGINETLSSLNKYNGSLDATPQLFLNTTLAYLMQGFTNSTIGQIVQGSEEFRQTYYTDSEGLLPASVQEQLAKASMKTPKFDFQTTDYINAWGEKQPGTGMVNSLFNPSYVATVKNGKLETELTNLYNELKDTDFKGTILPTSASRSTTVDDTQLSVAEYEEYAIAKGQKQKELITDFMDSKIYDKLTATQKGNIISDLYSLAGEYAKDVIQISRNTEQNSEYYKLLHNIEIDGENKTPISKNNLLNYKIVSSIATEAINNKENDTIETLLDIYDNGDENLKTVMSERTPRLNGFVDARNVGVKAKSWGEVKDTIKAVQADEDTSGVNSRQNYLALIKANIPEEDKLKLVNMMADSKKYNFSKNWKATHDVIYKKTQSLQDVYDFFNNADLSPAKDENGTYTATKANSKLSSKEIYSALQQMDSTPAEKEEMFNEFSSILAGEPSRYNGEWSHLNYQTRKYELDTYKYVAQQIKKYPDSKYTRKNLEPEASTTTTTSQPKNALTSSAKSKPKSQIANILKRSPTFVG